ncbi:hypothetical protein [Ramlibacter sp.]|uniref:hypothetical protein n=1 Tax=Ramlibacter sp. TaxID=1917967 RepID=UPI003D0E5FA0
MREADERAEFKAFFDAISLPRIRTYQRAFGSGNDRQVLGAYLWGQAAGAALQPFIGIAEVALRNAIHTSLSTQLSRGQSVSWPWYDQTVKGSLVLRGRTAAAFEAVLCDRHGVRLAALPSPDSVVASLSFGVWSDILASQLPPTHVGRTFNEVFPHHPYSRRAYWSHGASRTPVVERIKRLQRMRNRVSHSEPVWSPTMLVTSKGKHWTHAVHALEACLREFVELLGWISPVSLEIFRKSFAQQWVARLIATGAVEAFMRDPFGNGMLAEPQAPPRRSEVDLQPTFL